MRSLSGPLRRAGSERPPCSATTLAPATGTAWKVYNTALLASKKSVPNPSQWSSDPYSMTYYDGVNLMALAMLKANSTKPSDFASQIAGLTTPKPGGEVVYSFAQGKQALAAGKQIQYVGAGGPIVFDKWHNSSGAYEAVS